MSNVPKNPSQTTLTRMHMAMDAAVSVSMTHPPSCRCHVCLAAHGDPEGLAEVLELLERGAETMLRGRMRA